MFLPILYYVERNIDNTGWWVWIKAVEEKFLPHEPAPFFVLDSLYAD